MNRQDKALARSFRNHGRVVCDELVGGGGRGWGDFHASLGHEVAEGSFAASAALFVGDVTVLINHNIDGIDRGFVHGREIGVFHEDDAAGTRGGFEIFFDELFGFADVDGEDD